MAKTKEVTAPAKQESGDVSKISKVNESLSKDQLVKMLKNATVIGDINEEGDGVLNTGKFWNIEPGEGIKIIISSITKTPKKGSKDGEMIDAINIIDEENKEGITSLNNLVNFAKSNSEKLPMAVHVLCTGTAESKAGNEYKALEIRNISFK